MVLHFCVNKFPEDEKIENLFNVETFILSHG